MLIPVLPVRSNWLLVDGFTNLWAVDHQRKIDVILAGDNNLFYSRCQHRGQGGQFGLPPQIHTCSREDEGFAWLDQEPPGTAIVTQIVFNAGVCR